MVKDKNSTKQFLEYYSFWLFQYTQRNKLHREEMEKLDIVRKACPSLMREGESRIQELLGMCSKKHDNDDDYSNSFQKIIKLSEDFIKMSKPYLDLTTDIEIIDTALGHPFFPKVCSETKALSSDDILNIIIEKGTISKTAKPEYPRNKLYSSIGYDHRKRKAKDTSSEQERYINLKIDTDCSIDNILVEVASAFWDKKVHRLVLSMIEQLISKEHLASNGQPECVETTTHKVCQCLSSNDMAYFDKMQQSTSELIEFKIKQRIKECGRGFDLDDAPRASGLWIWDYVTTKYGENRPPRNAYAEAMRAFKERFDYVKLGYQETESGTYRNWYHRTAACIEACDVLSFKGDGRKKKTKD